MNLADISVKNSLLVNLLSVFIVLIGGFSMLQMRREAFPPVSYDIVTITTVYPGAPTEDVEQFVTIPIEREIKALSGIEKFYSTSDEGLSKIGIYIDPKVSDKAKVVADIQRAIDRMDNLPQDAGDPVVFELATREFPVLEISLSGPYPEGIRRRYADVLEDTLRDVPGVSQVQKYGWRDREFWVEVDPDKLRRWHVSIQEIIDALRTQNVTLPGGQLTTPTDEFNVRTTGEFRTPEEIAGVIIRANDAGNWLRVKDVATVKEAFEDPTTIAKINGQRATAMIVIKTDQADALKLVKRVTKVVDLFKKTLPKDMRLTITNDFSYYVKRRLGVLQTNGLIGFFLVLGILFLFLDPVPAFMTAMGIPIALFFSFWVMSGLGMTINLVSMLGLILVLGMLVDDGIIVSENVYRHVEEGMPPRKAAVVGTTEVMAPVTITILTTFAAFGPLLFMTDIIGKFIKEIPKVVMITLGASLAEAFLILPSHLADTLGYFHKPRRRSKEKRWFLRLQGLYLRCLKACLRERYTVILFFVVVFIFTLGIVIPQGQRVWLYGGTMIGMFLALAAQAFIRKRITRANWLAAGVLTIVLVAGMMTRHKLNFILFAGEGIEHFWIRAEAKKGTPLEKMNALMARVEDKVRRLPAEELDSFRTYIGGIQEERGFDPNAKRGSHLAQITVFLTPMQKRQRTPKQIAASLRRELASIKGFEKLYTRLAKEGPPTGPDIDVSIKGEDFEVMRRIAAPFMDYLRHREGVSDVTTSYDFGKKQLRVVVDEEKAKKYFLTVGRIASSVRNVFQGGVATTVKPRKAEQEIDVVVRYPKAARSDRKVFEKILVPNSRGNLVKLSAVARVEESEGIYLIHHLNGTRVLHVTAQVDNQKAVSMDVNKELQKRFKNVTADHMGYSVQYTGEFEDQMKTRHNLVAAYLFALFMIFILLVAMFHSLLQPFIVMCAIPFGVIGVILAFWLHDMILPGGRPLNFFAMMGLVGLTGVVVNDSVVLVDFINRRRLKGQDRKSSILEAGRIRLRPVIMTSITTIGGLISVAYGIGGGDPFLKPMALAIVWGLVFSTILTLVGIPCIYAIIDDLAEKGHYRVVPLTDHA